MATYLVLTIIGDDKPGLVGLLSETISRHSGNWLESNMSHLAGKFAGILRVSVGDDEADALVADLQGLSSVLKLVVEKVSMAEPAPRQRSLRLTLVGNDRPGIVREISRALAQAGVNVEELTTQISSAPMSGEPLFQAQAELKVPMDLDSAALQGRLEQLADDLIVEISLASIG
ncbi:MAG: glycine cleavage system protein R [Pseudomonadales bacterium]|nr:glycine cleavage system protein R [Pseudomonadales bacterium]MCP5330324.1 glycine cleavage system protein R [Pseudomonadales bacterium]MCP5344063.1 glycine cleavage system protein R [Pseudomonadales bacterium]